ncbi:MULTISPECIES: GntR family transcriptional regulator [Bacillaceae]|uniref:GntR family transcriptional regulator n=1 Tax=Bacillaceae TaxID=186817 RepID=UPI0020426299|nr:GntR family transcriptional regulator [Caldibacillus thermoamylovorans]MCM3056314.1 GntR family transcriptional regulator [Caldibacillus thermoamylovorans]
MNVKFNNRDPVYVQVVRYFKEQIAKGFFEPGQEIPSRRELAHRLKINPNTAQRAYKEMEEQGLIFTEGNLPSRITKDERVLKKVRKELIMEAVETFVHSVRTINVPLEEVLYIVKEYYEKADYVRGNTRD